jgi:hypothetical protein
VVHLEVFFFFVTRHSFNKQGSQRPYNKTKQERGVDLYHYKWRRMEGGGGGERERERK